MQRTEECPLDCNLAEICRYLPGQFGACENIVKQSRSF